MIITVNGEKRQFEGSELNVSELLLLSEVSAPDAVSVQINGKFVDKKDFAAKKIADEDEVDFLYFMGGGTFS